MTTITRWLTRAAHLVALSQLCACVTTYTPSPGAAQSMSVEEARRIVFDVAKPPAKFTSSYSGTYHVVYRSDMSDLVEDHYKVYFRTASLRIIGQNKYEIPFKDLSPSQTGQLVLVYSGPGIIGDGQVFHVDSRGFANPPDSQYFSGVDESSARRLVDALSALKSAASHLAQNEDAKFHDAAKAYLTTNPKPQLPEAARRFKVQAEGAVQDKDFAGAADYYWQAIDVAPWWPEGHFNRALVLSETGEFPDAIVEMNRYLELAPGAPDARAAQDKVYDWERKAR
jgi:tetratricopeptide (TPR) repeat protein